MVKDKKKALVLILSLIGLIQLFVIGLLLLLNWWLLNNSWFGFTFLKIDLRVWFIWFVWLVFSLWGLLELDDYLQFKKWRRSWK